MIAADGSEPWLLPAALDADTRNVYATPFVSPVTTHEVAEVTQDCPSGFDVTV